MPISFSSSRKDLVEIDLVAHQRQLVLHQRMIDDGDAFHGCLPDAQNTVPSLMTLIGGEPSARRANAAMRGRRPRCRLRACSPAAATRASRFEPRAHHVGQAVEQRHGQRAPFHDQRGIDLVRARCVGGIAQRQHADIDEQAAIAVFGKPGEAVDVGHLDAGALQRLDQRIGQPLRELVQRHEAVGRVVGLDRRMAPAIAERNAAERQPRRPDRPEMRAAPRDRMAGAAIAPPSARAAR